MSTSLKMFFLILIWGGIMAMQINFDMDMNATRRMKDSLELAVHDAALAIDKTKMSQGQIVFERTKAEENLRQSLQQNLLLSSSLEPLTGSFLQAPVEIKVLEYYDDDSGMLFPFNYSNPTYEILDTIDGPAIVVVIETTSPRYFSGTPMTIRQSVVYEYKNL